MKNLYEIIRNTVIAASLVSVFAATDIYAGGAAKGAGANAAQYRARSSASTSNADKKYHCSPGGNIYTITNPNGTHTIVYGISVKKTPKNNKPIKK